jgi:hypothetical protein
MNIRAERERLGLSQAEFIRKVRPFMHSIALDKHLLCELEEGRGGAERRKALIAAMTKAFPIESTSVGTELSGTSGFTPGTLAPQKRAALAKFPLAKWVVRTFTVLALLLFSISLIWFQDHPYAKSFERALSFIAAIGTVFSAYWATRQPR